MVQTSDIEMEEYLKDHLEIVRYEMVFGRHSVLLFLPTRLLELSVSIMDFYRKTSLTFLLQNLMHLLRYLENKETPLVRQSDKECWFSGFTF